MTKKIFFRKSVTYSVSCCKLIDLQIVKGVSWGVTFYVSFFLQNYFNSYVFVAKITFCIIALSQLYRHGKDNVKKLTYRETDFKSRAF